jgi:hypothetical protein
MNLESIFKDVGYWNGDLGKTNQTAYQTLAALLTQNLSKIIPADKQLKIGHFDAEYEQFDNDISMEIETFVEPETAVSFDPHPLLHTALRGSTGILAPRGVSTLIVMITRKLIELVPFDQVLRIGEMTVETVEGTTGLSIETDMWLEPIQNKVELVYNALVEEANSGYRIRVERWLDAGRFEKIKSLRSPHITKLLENPECRKIIDAIEERREWEKKVMQARALGWHRFIQSKSLGLRPLVSELRLYATYLTLNVPKRETLGDGEGSCVDSLLG